MQTELTPVVVGESNIVSAVIIYKAKSEKLFTYAIAPRFNAIALLIRNYCDRG